MSKLRLTITMSLDGYAAGPDQSEENPLGVGGMELHQWFFPVKAFREMHGESDGETNASSPVVEERQANMPGFDHRPRTCRLRPPGPPRPRFVEGSGPWPCCTFTRRGWRRLR
jgi:hypothetical protein